MTTISAGSACDCKGISAERPLPPGQVRGRTCAAVSSRT
jgi:hypothetical protein